MANSIPPRPEFDFIDWIRARSKSRPEVLLGIGDDAALLSQTCNFQWVTTVDVLTEGVHFTSHDTPELIGRKGLAVNLSDMAAMAADPVAAFIGIVLPQSRDRAYAEKIYEGLFQIAQEYHVCIAGGDTNSWDGGLVLNVTLLGTVSTGRAVLRSGARPGDWLFVSGPLGGSFPSGRHLTFEPRVNLARILSNQFGVTAMLDLSDGLASDVQHLARESGVGVIIEAESIPIHADVDPHLSQPNRLLHALCDGEDFELLFTTSPESGDRLCLAGEQHGWSVTRIGICTESPELILRTDLSEAPLPLGGWSHHISGSC